jgi:steroid delta-isomerase-like uncharacterized protein
MKAEKAIALAEQNKDVVRRAVQEIWNEGKYDNVEKYVSSDFVVHSAIPGEDIHGPGGVIEFFTYFRKAFPDLQFTIVDMIAESDRVVTHYTIRGTHRGEFKGIPATGKSININGTDIDRLVDGKTVECWPNLDELSLLQQLGVSTLPEQNK